MGPISKPEQPNKTQSPQQAERRNVSSGKFRNYVLLADAIILFGVSVATVDKIEKNLDLKLFQARLDSERLKTIDAFKLAAGNNLEAQKYLDAQRESTLQRLKQR